MSISNSITGELTTDVLVVGAGPGGAAAAAWAARAGHDVTLIDMATFPRDKTCGDGLTPRAVAELTLLGLGPWLAEHPRIGGLRLFGFGQDVPLRWPTGKFPAAGSAVSRTELDNQIRLTAEASGARMIQGAKAVGAEIDATGVCAVRCDTAGGPLVIRPRHLIVADGVRSGLGKILGRRWHQDTVFGTAARAYIATTDDELDRMCTHLDARDPNGDRIPGYGWIFPLGQSAGTGGERRQLVNIGIGALATDKRPAKLALRPALLSYVEAMRDEFALVGAATDIRSALLPMGGAVSGIAGRNWVLIGDAAGCVNPLNGEGIDYALETARLAVENLDAPDLATRWPQLLNAEYGQIFSAARRFGNVFTLPGVIGALGPVVFRSDPLMRTALRIMGNLIHHDDRDAVAKISRGVGSLSQRADSRPPFLASRKAL